MLVDYGSDSDIDDAASPPPKRRRTSTPPPPLPAAFHDLYAAPPRQSRVDDPTLHGGRTRLVPHVEGNWSAHVYLEWHPDAAAAEAITQLINTLESSLTSSLYDTATHVPQPLHISLSAPLILTSRNVDTFREAMLAALGKECKALAKTSLHPTGLSWHANAAKTRGFAVLRVDRCAMLETLLAASNRIARDFGCAELYAGQEMERFHVSIAWGLDAKLYPEGNIKLDSGGKKALQKVQDLAMDYSEVKVKVGREVISVPFGRRSKA